MLAVGVCFSLTACDDPTSVGVDLVDEQTGRPIVIERPSTQLDAADADDLTGNSERVLAGRVEDPMLGTLISVGYVDFAGISGLSSEFGTGTISSVTLNLLRDYVYGDTTATVTMRLSDMTEDWDPQGGRADTSLTAGTSILEFSFLATDTLISVSLPQAWIDANAETLQSSTFSIDFNGFELSYVSGNAVTGFLRAGSSLEVVVGTESADFPVSETLSAQTRVGTPDVPSDHVLIQDGLGPGLLFDFDYSDLENSALNRVAFRFRADVTASLDNRPPHFVRPLLNELELFRLNDDDEFFLVDRADLDGDGRFVFDSGTLRQNLQQIFLDEDTPDRFVLGFRTRAATLNAVLLNGLSATETAPAAQLTLILADQ